MPDVFTKEKRSWVMSRVGHYNTKPEVVVRKLLHGMGFRFRLHRRDLPGVPDIVLPKYQTVIFVHGCFWHGHDCRKARLPGSNIEFWKDKIARNRSRDQAVQEKLVRDGWRVLVVWGCELSDLERVRNQLQAIAH